MSTFITSTRRAESTSTTTRKRESTSTTHSTTHTTTYTTTHSTSSDAPESTTREPQPSSIEFDSATPTPSPTDPRDDSPSSTVPSLTPSATCSSNRDCSGDKKCSRGTCTTLVEAAPFGLVGDSSSEPTTKLSTASAIGVGLGIIGVFLLLIGVGAWLWRRRGRRPPPKDPVQRPMPSRSRSASSATDQKTLVASLPNSPQQADFRVQQAITPAFFAKLAETSNARRPEAADTEKYAHEQISAVDFGQQKSLPNEKSLPIPPSNMPLPPPPTKDVRYAINVNINKSMIFEDLSFNTATPRDSGSSRDRMPKYRFEEYLPPIAKTPQLSISETRSRTRTSDYELEPYPRKLTAREVDSSSDEEDDDDETRLRRKSTMKTIQSKPPQLPAPQLPPPSPSFSMKSYFNSYDWYQDIIGTENPTFDNRASKTPTIPDRSPARTPTRKSFAFALSANPPDTDSSLWPPPLSPMSPQAPPSLLHLHPSTAASPKSSQFTLSPTVYTMPSKPPKAQPMRASLMSTKARASLKSSTTRQSHVSRSWLPDDGLYLPEEGTHDSFQVYRRRFSDDSRPSSYTPF
jgi:hypothetical protein